MVVITRQEKDKILEAFPKADIVRPMRKHSERHRYYMEEHPVLKKYLEQLRKASIISENGEPVNYPDPQLQAIKSEYYRRKKDSSFEKRSNRFDGRQDGKRKYPRNQNNGGNYQNKNYRSSDKGNDGYNRGSNNRNGNYGSGQKFDNGYHNDYRKPKPRTNFKPKGGWKSEGATGNWGSSSFDKSARSSKWDDRGRDKDQHKKYDKDKWF